MRPTFRDGQRKRHIKGLKYRQDQASSEKQLKTLRTKSLQMVTAAMKLEDAGSLEGKL